MMKYKVGQELYLKRRYADGGMTVTVEKVGHKYVHCTFGWSIEVATNHLTGIGHQQYEVFASKAAFDAAKRLAVAKRMVISTITMRLDAARTLEDVREVLQTTDLLSLWEDKYGGVAHD